MKRDAVTIIEVCVGLNCALSGSYLLLENIKTHYNLEIGSVSDNGILIVEKECVRDCPCGVIIFINGLAYKQKSFKDIIKYIDALSIRKHLYDY
jgi:NADH:ubiquinone oxidoreductase subunit E